MKKYIAVAIFAWVIGYIYANFGNVSDFGVEYMPNELEYRTRGGRSGTFHNRLENRPRYDEDFPDYQEQEGNPDETRMENRLEYRGRSARTGRYVHRSRRR